MADTGEDASLEVRLPTAATPEIRPERAFNVSLLISAVRCTLSYVVLPFALPLLGLAPGVGPILGVTIGVVAIAANVYSIRRFWSTGHPWRRPITVLHVGVIALLVVLIVVDLGALLG